MLDRSPYSAERLMAVILGQIGRDVIQRQGEAPAATAITHPANWGPYKLELFDQAFRIANVEDHSRLPEPQAAAIIATVPARDQRAACDQSRSSCGPHDLSWRRV